MPIEAPAITDYFALLPVLDALDLFEVNVTTALPDGRFRSLPGFDDPGFAAARAQLVGDMSPDQRPSMISTNAPSGVRIVPTLRPS